MNPRRHCPRIWFWLGVWVLLPAGLSAAPPSPTVLAEQIDKRITAKWKADKVTPAESADDATFARRVYLDLIGRIPTVAEVRSFLDDKAADKRAKLTDRLLDSPAHARHLATLWRREWVPQADLPQSTLGDELDDWLTARLKESMPYDRLARELLTAGQGRQSPPVRGRDVPTTFLTASEYKPENLAANTARAFLGVNLDCAQCHDHPFARWTRDQFWQTAAFFTRPTADDTPRRFEIALPGGKKSVGPKLLDDQPLTWPEVVTSDTARTVLADWVTAKGNPYFARNAVNRAWSHLFGTGLVEPLDDLSGQNPASHPELFDELAKAFADGGFNLKSLYAALVRTKAYQLSSVPQKGQPAEVRHFAHAAVRGLTGEQLYDSLRVAAGLPPTRDDLDPLTAGRARKQFAERFRIERPGQAQRSILQALVLMNNARTADLTNPTTTPVLKAADAPFLDSTGKVEALFAAVYARKPTADELAPLVKHVEAGKDDPARSAALADVFWALLNSAEFHTNH